MVRRSGPHPRWSQSHRADHDDGGSDGVLCPQPQRTTDGDRRGRGRNAWFTEPGVSKIGRITPSGQVTEFPVPGIRATIDNLALAPDGNLWYAAHLRSRVDNAVRSDGELCPHIPERRLPGIPAARSWRTALVREQRAQRALPRDLLPRPLHAPADSGPGGSAVDLRGQHRGDEAHGHECRLDDSPTELGYQWQLCDAAGNGCGDIAGADTPDYVLTSGDVGHTLRVAAIASTVVGSGEQLSAPSSVVVPAPPGPPETVRLKAVGAFLTWHFGHRGRASIVAALIVHSLEKGETIRSTCAGRGCVSHRSELARRGHCNARSCTRTQPGQDSGPQPRRPLPRDAVERRCAGDDRRGRARQVRPDLYLHDHDPQRPARENELPDPRSFTAAYAC